MGRHRDTKCETAEQRKRHQVWGSFLRTEWKRRRCVTPPVLLRNWTASWLPCSQPASLSHYWMKSKCVLIVWANRGATASPARGPISFKDKKAREPAEEASWFPTDLMSGRELSFNTHHALGRRILTEANNVRGGCRAGENIKCVREQKRR